MRIKVYVAGPLRVGNRYDNTHNAIIAGRELLRLGFAPFVPHLCTFMDPDESEGGDNWMSLDFAWLKEADVMLRLPGESIGSDAEVEFCRDNHIPVLFGGVPEVVSWAEAVRVREELLAEDVDAWWLRGDGHP